MICYGRFTVCNKSFLPDIGLMASRAYDTLRVDSNARAVRPAVLLSLLLFEEEWNDKSRSGG